MTENRAYAVWLRSLAGLVALAGVLGLSACGGGSGAPNNVFNSSANTPLAVLPGDSIAYSGIAIALTASGGTPPYKAFSSNSAILPVTQAVPGSTILLLAANVFADTAVTVTVQDSSGGATATAAVPVAITVRAAPLVNSLTITPNSGSCGTTAICSGQTGTASVSVQGPQGGPLAGRQVRFDVVAGPYGITTTNPAQPIVSSLTVISDASGSASVIIKANVDAPTQFSQLRVTDVTSGQQLTGNFLIQQITDGSAMTVVPATATITGAGTCSSGFATDYRIYGGTPPYRVTASFPTAVTIINPTVNTSGGFFEAITNGTCVDPVTFSILDAAGRQTSLAKLSNLVGTAPAVPATAALTAVPAAIADPACTGKTFNILVFGGQPPYNVKPTPPGTTSTPTLSTAGDTAKVAGYLTASGANPVLFLDSSLPQKSLTVTITCS